MATNGRPNAKTRIASSSARQVVNLAAATNPDDHNSHTRPIAAQKYNRRFQKSPGPNTSPAENNPACAKTAPTATPAHSTATCDWLSIQVRGITARSFAAKYTHNATP